MTIAPSFSNTQTISPRPQTQSFSAPKQDSGVKQSQTLGREAFMARRAVFESGATPRQFVDEQSVKQLESALDLNKGGSLRNLHKLGSFKPSSMNKVSEQESGESEGQQSGGKQISKSVRPPVFESESCVSESEEPRVA